MPPRKLVKVAHAAETKRQLAKALRIYNLVRSRADHADRVDMHDVFIRTARIHETMGESQKACDLYVEEAHRLRDDGKLAGAANTLRRACRLAGEGATPLHTRLVRWLVEDGEHAQAHDELLDLLSQGKPDSEKAATEVVECARMLLEVAPGDAEVEAALAKFEQ